MFRFDVSQADLIADLRLMDASSLNHGPLDDQFPDVICDLVWTWAMVDAENGKRYQLIRAIGPSGTFDYVVHECYPDIFTYPRHIRIPGDDAEIYWGLSVWLPQDEGKFRLIPAHVTMARKHPLRISVGPKEITWRDSDVLDITLTPLPNNVTRIHTPGRPDPVGYISSGCTVSGTVEGSTIVGGYGGFDRMYALPGLSCSISKMANLEHYWFVWYAELEDGSWETGNCMLGAGGYATATFNRPGEDPVACTNDEVQSKVNWKERDGKSEPASAQLTFGGHTFDFTATHNSASCAADLGVHWVHHTVQRQRGPKALRSWSTMEVIKKGLAGDRDGKRDGHRATPRD